MLMTVTLLTVLSRFPFTISDIGTCVPNSQFIVNGGVCFCDSFGQWTEANCQIQPIARRLICKSGQVIWQGCNKCVCQKNGLLACVEGRCPETPEVTPPEATSNPSISTVISWCTPFRSYYVNCSICICPASGKSSEARCASDSSCSFVQDPPSPSDFSTKKSVCIPKVMYLFPCLHCLCSDDGFFIIDKCVETCQGKEHIDRSRRCIPNTFYRKDCNVCQCPNNSLLDDKLCTKSVCDQKINFGFLQSLRSKSYKCQPHRFSKPRCLYCECNPPGNIDENACLELDCLINLDFKYDVARETCSPGEMVPICMECLCLRNGMTNTKYCSRACSYKSKLSVLENIMKENDRKNLINWKVIEKKTANDLCDPYTVYGDRGRYCLCPENGITNFNLCTSAENITSLKIKNESNKKIIIDFNMTCEPNTFVDFDCNTCFCNKTGRLDPKWCTYDDCEAKRLIQEAHASNEPLIVEIKENCNPGSIYKVDCNFCICPVSGFIKDQVCTRNDCSSFDKTPSNDQFTCEPLAYYEVDCNICFCPRDGQKNVAKCSKNHCEKSYLRSDVCVPGQLFSDECNVCVCPPNGNKVERACANTTCADTAPWKKIFQLSESLLGNQINEDTTRNLDFCFPGEEFIIGCKLCTCPDMGLRAYAACSPVLCDEEENTQSHFYQNSSDENRGIQIQKKLTRRHESCTTYNLTDCPERKHCTPGSMYIIRCRQCICPYMGNINRFCRPLPDGFFCEQAYPNINYIPMGRRIPEGNKTVNNSTVAANTTVWPESVPHLHTKYYCDRPGKIMDECFICECEEEDNVLIEEHCFRSDNDICKNTTTPSFLSDYNKLNPG